MSALEQGTLLLTMQPTEPAPAPKHTPGFALLVLAGFSVAGAFAWSDMQRRRAERMARMAEVLESADALVVIG